MNQVEIAKRILELDGDCNASSQHCICCEFKKICTSGTEYDGDLYHAALVYIEVMKDNKGYNMIDLTKNQIVDPPVKCWVMDMASNTEWKPRWLKAIISGSFYCYEAIEHNESIGKQINLICWQQCSLTDPAIPTKKIKKWLTVEDVPVELWGKALVKRRTEAAYSSYIMTPVNTFGATGNMIENLHYLPLGQPLTGEWLPFESVVEE